jgi:hypothetical protein
VRLHHVGYWKGFIRFNNDSTSEEKDKIAIGHYVTLEADLGLQRMSEANLHTSAQAIMLS